MIVHVGLGKTGTTALQNRVFPEVARKLGMTYWTEDPETVRKLRGHAEEFLRSFDPGRLGRLQIPEATFISWERLCCLAGGCWDPYFFEPSAEANFNTFGASCHILLTVRNPRDFLTAAFTQNFHNNRIVWARDFFVSDEVYSRLPPSAPKFAIERFSYSALIAMYRKRFQKVTVAKYENLQSLEFLRHLVELDESDLLELKARLRQRQYNRSYSSRAIQLTRLANQALGVIGSDLQAYQTLLTKLSIRQPRSLAGKCYNRAVSMLRWRFFIQHIFDRVVPYRKPVLDFSAIPGLDLTRLEAEYEQLDPVATYRSASGSAGPLPEDAGSGPADPTLSR